MPDAPATIPAPARAPVAAGLGTLCAAPLFLAPLLAGLSLAPTAVMPAFVAVWAVWLVLVRPAAWRRRAVPGAALGGLWLRVLAQALLLGALFGVGRGLAVLIGGAAALPGWAPVLLALAALPLAGIVARLPVLDAARVPADQGKPAGSGA